MHLARPFVLQQLLGLVTGEGRLYCPDSLDEMADPGLETEVELADTADIALLNDSDDEF